MQTTLIALLPLDSPDATLPRVGGKGANLAELSRAGFPVPPGFLIPTEAYDLFLEVNDLRAKLIQIVQRTPADDPVALDHASEEIRVLFEQGQIPPELAAPISAAYERLDTQGESAAVAVRSSATAEDLPGFSFAGQQDTYLNVVGVPGVLDAVKRCWGSLWTARAMGYRARNGIESDGVALAVVVQRMIASEVSGILFTANPLTGHRREMVIDASYGLGEAIVSGQVEPDHYVIARDPLRVTQRKLGAKALAIRPQVGGGTEHVTQDSAAQQALPDSAILELARIAERIEQHFGSPQDIEWAWADGKLTILQSRPITSLYPLPAGIGPAGDLRVLFSFNSIQGVIDPITPMGQEMFKAIVRSLVYTLGLRFSLDNYFLSAGGRIYINLTVVMRDPKLREVALGVLSQGDPGARRTMINLLETGRIPEHKTLHPLHILRTLWKLSPILVRVFGVVLNPTGRREKAMTNAEKYVATIGAQLKADHSLRAQLAAIDAAISLPKFIAPHILPPMVVGLGSQRVVGEMLHKWLGVDSEAVRRMLRGLPDNVTTEMDLVLWKTAQTIRRDPDATAHMLDHSLETLVEQYKQGTLPKTAHDAIEAFLNRYGMRAVAEIDMGRQRWREDPRSIFQTLCSYLQIDDAAQAPDRMFERAAAEAERLAAEYVVAVRQRKGNLRARLLAAAIRRMRLLSGLREMPKYYMIKLIDLFRSSFLETGVDLVKQGKLIQPDDIFFVPIQRLRDFANGKPLDLRAIVAAERALYDQEKTRRQIPRVLLNTGEAFYDGLGRENDDPNALVGDGVSPGSVEGRVRVVLDPRGVRLEHGEILVCPATDPGWTPLFLSAGGLVMELGGMITHGSVVAREYGIPAVVGVHEATLRLKTGQRVRVDGSSGQVTLLD